MDTLNARLQMMNYDKILDRTSPRPLRVRGTGGFTKSEPSMLMQ